MDTKFICKLYCWMSHFASEILEEMIKNEVFFSCPYCFHFEETINWVSLLWSLSFSMTRKEVSYIYLTGIGMRIIS